MVGGHVEPGETARQALIREAQEEVGLTPVNFTFLESLMGHAPNLPECVNDIFVIREWIGGEPGMLGDEHTELRWFTVDEACALEDLAFPEYPRIFRKLAGNATRRLP